MPDRPHVEEEILSQPDSWKRAADIGRRGPAGLPSAGERVAVCGCGTSWFVAQSYAAWREESGEGETDAFPASEMPVGRRYDRVVAITRSGTTTEVLRLLERLRDTQTVAIIADPRSPAARLADKAVVLDFADERSVVQTRFATSTLALLRAHLGHDPAGFVSGAEQAVSTPLPAGALDRSQFTFLGRGPAVGVANEAALKMREAALAWAESYPAMEYRHGPLSVADQRSCVWFLGDPPPGLSDEVSDRGALVVAEPRDPLVELIRVQRLAVALSLRRGLDPDQPRALTRSVVLSDGGAEAGA